VIRIKQQKLDQFHWQVAKSLNNLAQVLFAQKEYYKAEPICQNVLDILIRQRGPEHSEVGIALDNLAKIYAATGRREKAQRLLEQAKDIKIKAFGDTHTYVGTTLDHLASNLLATVTNDHPNKEKILEDCKMNYEKALNIFKTTYGDMHSALGITNNNLGLLHLKLKVMKLIYRDMSLTPVTEIQRGLAIL
jgi:tetratricopeptide (TPR) repeat protein